MRKKKKSAKFSAGFIFSHLPYVANLLILVVFVCLPFYLFEGRLFLGGDDTRFYFVYPKEFLSSLGFYSWNNIASLPYYIPNHYWLPFLFAFSLVDQILNSKILLQYLSFSSVLILGFLYFQKLVRELVENDFWIAYISSLIYVISPLTLVSYSFFLAPVWLVALVPIVAYYFVCYVRRALISDLVKVTIWSFFFSFAYFAIPWVAAFILPFLFAFIFYIFFLNNLPRKVIHRSVIFGFTILSSQLFWILPFISSMIYGGSRSLRERVVSAEVTQSFADTVLSTATDNIIYPLLTLYHRKIVFDFEWQLMHVFTEFYDLVMPLGVIYLAVLFIGFSKFGKVLNPEKKKLFLFIISAFLIVLYFSTVNIGFLKQLFLVFINIPGFAMFRNFTDKFALSYIFIYSILLAFSLLITKKTVKYYKIVFIFVLIVVLVNFLPVKKIIVSPLWKTQNIITTVNIPAEYIDFVEKVKMKVPKDANVFAYPQNITAYSIITEENGSNAYIGTSPFKFFTGINDLPGADSYTPDIASQIRESILNRNYERLKELLVMINARYLMVTSNIPKQVMRSYLFDKEYLQHQDVQVIEEIAGEEVVKSENGNYTLYKIKPESSLFSTKAKVDFKKISPVEYELKFKNLKGSQEIIFHETYNPGWKLYSDGVEVFTATHRQHEIYGNIWTLNSEEIMKTNISRDIKLNNDGSINFVLKVYFFPQVFFYIGIALTLLLTTAGFIIIKLTKNNEK